MDLINWDELLLPYAQAVDELMVKFSSLASGFAKLDKNSPIEQVEGRVKRVSSILEKASRKGIPTDKISQQMEDIAGIRIISRFIGDIEKVIEIIKNRDGLDLELVKERDYITNIKSSGYRSYHLIIKYPVITAFGYAKVSCEIQVRTMAMNFWATIEHSLKYKYNRNIPDHLKQRLISTAKAAARLDNEMNEIRHEILEAQETLENKTTLVDEILTNMQTLHYSAKVEEVIKLNNQFFQIYENGNFDQLLEFSRQIKVMREMYRV